MANDRELLAAGRLAGDALAGLVGAVAHVHRSISDRAFTAAGAAAQPARAIHDGISAGAYTAIRAAHGLAPRLGAAVAVVVGKGDETASWSTAGRAPLWLSALNGLRGDHLADHYPELAVPMSLRDHGGDGDLCLRADEIRAALPDASGELVVFVHGWCESDRSWWHRAAAHHGDPTVTYGSMLQAEVGCTPLYLRYNTGLAIADNGAALDSLMTDLVQAWPVPVTRISFVGHSMGGLVIRQACHDADLASSAWAALVHHVVCLGTPHLGAPLARGVERIVPPLSRIGATQPLARLLDDRSAGVRDLERGLGTDADLPFLDHADWSFIGATITRDRHHPLGHALGDLLVRYHSATGDDRTERSSFDLGEVEHVGGIHHLDLLDHPEVYAQIVRRLRRSPRAPSRRRAART